MPRNTIIPVSNDILALTLSLVQLAIQKKNHPKLAN